MTLPKGVDSPQGLGNSKRREVVFKQLYLLPGIIILWIIYQNPKGGITGVAKSGRNYRSPVFTFLTATGFWAAGIALVAGELGNSSPYSPSGSYSNQSGGITSTLPNKQTSTAPNTDVLTTAAAPEKTSNQPVDSACTKAKSAAAVASSEAELELAKAKVGALC
jgi:hypothetical protein